MFKIAMWMLVVVNALFFIATGNPINLIAAVTLGTVLML